VESTYSEEAYENAIKVKIGMSKKELIKTMKKSGHLYVFEKDSIYYFRLKHEKINGIEFYVRNGRVRWINYM
jgi:hypothetical protein